MVKPNRFPYDKISMIWGKTAMGDKNYQRMSSTQLDSHFDMVVVRKQACIIQHTWKMANVRPFSNECLMMKQADPVASNHGNRYITLLAL